MVHMGKRLHLLVKSFYYCHSRYYFRTRPLFANERNHDKNVPQVKSRQFLMFLMVSVGPSVGRSFVCSLGQPQEGRGTNKSVVLYLHWLIFHVLITDTEHPSNLLMLMMMEKKQSEPFEGRRI